MKKPTRYLYVVYPGNLPGAAFLNVYEMDNLVEVTNALPVAQGADEPVERTNRNWTQAVVRLPKAFRRLVRRNPLFRARKAGAAV